MKTIKGTISTGLTVLMAAFMMVGCGKNSDNNQPAAVQNPYGINNPYGFPQCPTCAPTAAGGATFATSSNQQYGEALQLQFVSQGSSGLYGQSAMVQATGQLIIGQYAFQCGGLPPGNYPVQSQPFPMQGNAAQNIMMIGQGPNGPIQIQISRLFFTTPTTFQVNGYFNNCQIAYY